MASDRSEAVGHTCSPALLAFVAVVISLRLGLSFGLPRVIKWDEPMYLLLGYNLLAGNGFTYHTEPELAFPPLYPIVAGVLHLWFHDFERASNVVYGIFGGLLLLPVFALARRIYGLRTAWVAVILVALFPALNINVLYWGSMTEPLYIFLIYAALAALLTGLDDYRLRMLAAAGMLFGLAYLTRPEAVAYVGLFALLALLWRVKEVGLTSFQPWTAVGVLGLSFAIFAAPYMWYLHAHTGQWMLSGKVNMSWRAGGGESYEQLTNGLDSSGTEISWLSPDRFKTNTLQTILADPLGLMHRVTANIRNLRDQFFERIHFWWGLVPMVVIALFQVPWDRRRLWYEMFLMTIIASVLVVFLPFGVMMRYLAPMFPVLLIWTARGALDMGMWLHETWALSWGAPCSGPRLIRTLSWLPAGMVAGFLVLTMPVAARGWINATFFGDKEAGLWLKVHTAADARVMTQEIGTALYAERRYVPSPMTDPDRFMRYARAHGADYLVVRDFKLTEYRPQLASLIKSGTPDLQLIYAYQEPHMVEPVRTLIYHIGSSSVGQRTVFVNN